MQPCRGEAAQARQPCGGEAAQAMQTCRGEAVQTCALDQLQSSWTLPGEQVNLSGSELPPW